VASSASAGGFKWSDSFREKVDNIKLKLEKKYQSESGTGTEWDWEDWRDESDGDKKVDYDWKHDCLWCGDKGDRPKSAIPEPTAAFLFAGGATVIAMRRRRNR
jgi:hypothetical protein